MRRWPRSMRSHATDSSSNNTAAARELAELEISRSRFEQSAPLLAALAQQYPADTVVGDEAASVFRSLAYHDPAQIDRAVAIERNLSAADPANLDRLAAIGDTYADSTSSELNLDTQMQLTQAAPYWQRMATVHPGVADGYLQSATVFWDYFEFDRALARRSMQDENSSTIPRCLTAMRPGAIYEDKDDMAGAVKGNTLPRRSRREAMTAELGDRRSDAGRKTRIWLRWWTRRRHPRSHKHTGGSPQNALQLRASVLVALHRSAELAAMDLSSRSAASKHCGGGRRRWRASAVRISSLMRISQR